MSSSEFPPSAPYIIAECGINHNQSLPTALKLVDTAKECGADVVKFQIENPTEYCLTQDEMIRVYMHCLNVGIPFACTAFDVPSLRFLLANCKMPFLKLASCDAMNENLVYAVEKAGLPIIQSLKRWDKAITYGRPRHMLHVVAEYPTPSVNADLRRLNEDGIAGISDHSGTPYAAIIAASMGAKIIECHLTLDKSMSGPDHLSSLDPAQFKTMVKYVHIAADALGDL